MKKLLIAAILGFLFLVGMVIFISIRQNQPAGQSNQSTITFMFDRVEGATVELYENSDQASTSGVLGAKIADISPNQSLSLDNTKNYVIKISGNKIEPHQSVVYLKQAEVKWQIYISKTEAELANIKQTELENITNSARQNLAKWLNIYQLEQDKIKVLADGKWAVVPLKYNGADTLNRDQLFAVFQQTEAGWQVAAEPRVVVTKVEFPNIPNTVILEAAPTETPAK